MFNATSTANSMAEGFPDPDQVQRQLSRIDWDFSGFNPSGGMAGIHGLHWYPAPFPPALAGTLIDILSNRTGTFADPFSGSGVAPIEAWLRGNQVVGIDNNEFAVELGRAKGKLMREGTAADGERIAGAFSAFRREHLSCWERLEDVEVCEAAGMDSAATRWFVRQVLSELAVVKSWLADPERGPGEWAGVCWLLVSSLLHGKLSKVRDYHYTYVVDRSRVKKEALEPVNVSGLYIDRIRTQFTEGEFTRMRLARAGVDLGRLPAPHFCRGLGDGLEGIINPVDLVVTSPPYFGMNDYVRSQYLTWLIFPWPGYEEQIGTESGSRRSRRSRVAFEGYLTAMENTFKGLHRAITPGGYLAVVIGNSTNSLARETDPTESVRHLIEATQFESIWRGERRIRFRKINNTPYRSESIWVFRR